MGVRVSKEMEELMLAADMNLSKRRCQQSELQNQKPPQERKSKYKAKAVYRTQQGIDVIRSGSGFTTITGIPFAVDDAEKIADSLKEYRRYLTLVSLQAAGIISGLRTQVDYVLHGPNGAKLCVYVADFVYIENGREVVEDVKGMKTAMYRLKKKMIRDEYGIEIKET